jgi:hypothetical protein
MMTKSIALLGFLVTVSLTASAQVEPAASGPARPSGSLTYSMHDSETAWWSGTLGDQWANSVSGIVNYRSGKAKQPFTVQYAGGYTFTLSQPTYDTGYFQNLAMTESIGGHKWRISIADIISYRPQSPTFGLAGVPGSGDILTGPPTTGSPTETVLTENTHTINNTTSVSYGLPINYALSITAAANYQILRFPDGNGINTSAIFGSFGGSWRFNANTTMTGNFSESAYGYEGSTISFRTSSLQGSISHNWAKGFSTHGSIGPSWVTSSGGSLIPSSTHLSLAGGVSYHKHFDTISGEYYHGDNEGSGIFYGAQFDSLSLIYSRKIERRTTLSARLGFERNTSLQAGVGSTSGIFSGVSLSRRLGRLFSFGASYLLTRQGSSGQLPDNVLNATLQGITISVGFAPRGMQNIEQR